MPERIAAYHEAGHVVLAVASRFHSLVDLISVDAAYGEAPVSLSRRKVKATGRPADTPKDIEAAQADPEIAADGAIVFLGGFAAERRYCQQIGHQPDPALSRNDYNIAEYVLGLAKVETAMANFEAEAEKRVNELWPIISEFAEELHKRRTIDPVDALEFIERRLGQ